MRTTRTNTKAPSTAKRIRMTKRKAVATATSPVALGKALVLLTTSCAALGTGGGSLATTRRTATPRGGRSHHRGPGECRASTVARRYRDGDEDQPVDTRWATQGAVATELTGSVVRAQMATAPAPTWAARTLPHFTLAWPDLPGPGIRLSMPSRPPHSPPDEEQLVMDEYLEFVEKRYSRLHPKHRPKQHATLDLQAVARSFFLSKLSLERLPPLTVVPTYNAHDSPVQQQEEEEEEDPLNILGLSGLASARLQRRLHLHVPRDLRDEALFLSSLHLIHRAAAPLSPAPAPPSPTPPSAAIAAAGGRTSSYVALSFPAQLRLLGAAAGAKGAALRRLARTFAHAARLLAAVAGRTATEVAAKGGARRSARALGPVLGAVLLVTCRPLCRGAWRSTSA